MLRTFFSALSLASFVSAHSTWQQIWINGVDGGGSCLRSPVNNDPIYVNQPELACNNAASSPNICTIKPGDQVTVEMHQQNNERTCSKEALGGNHWGPINIYMAAVNNSRTADGSTAGWFKVHESGLVSTKPFYWAVNVLNANCGHWTFTVPDIAPGHYLLRPEAIALHVSQLGVGAQFFPSCFQMNVIGNGTARPPTVRIPGVYKADDPSLSVNIYQPPLDYSIPGPRPYGYTAPPIANTPYPTTATWNTNLQPSWVPNTTPAVNPVPTSVITQSPSSPSSAIPIGGPYQTQWGQCGGQTWTGPTQCTSPYTCKVSNEYYSQCV